MPDLYENDIKEKPILASTEEMDVVRKLLEYTEPRLNPFKADYEQVIAECYNFIELRQWDGMDIAALSEYGVPEIPVDRIGRARDTINGIRGNTGNKKKIVKRETGDDRIAEILDKAGEYVEYTGNLDQMYDDAFDNVTAVGLGMTEIGWDGNLSGGEGDFYFENIEPEDCGWSYTKRKDFSDLRWIWKKIKTDWENAIKLNPSKAGELKTLRTLMGKKWEEIKGDSAGLYRDYESSFTATEGNYIYPSQVEIYVLWMKRIIPYKKVAFYPPPTIGQMYPQLPQVKKVQTDYQTPENEMEVGDGSQEVWYQYLIATGNDKKGGVLLSPKEGSPSEFGFHPFAPMIAEFKKSGMPRGFVETVISHQKRINMAWAQKMAYNNKTIKSPIVLRNADPAMHEHKLKQTAFGAVWYLSRNEELVNVNIQPNVNLQAIEEGNIARQDMDFAAAASEPVLRGQAETGSSGIRLAKQQDAAITPLNKWVKAESLYKLVLWRKILQIMIRKYNAQRLSRIIGEQRFNELLIGKLDPITQKPLQPPLEFPLTVDVAQYDVVIQDSSVSDFNKQQTFNSVIALQQLDPMGMFDDEFLITSAPIKDTDAALASNKNKRNDIIRQLMTQIQILETLLKTKSDQETKGKSQAGNAQKGKAQSQSGQQSMIGGSLMAAGRTT